MHDLSCNCDLCREWIKRAAGGQMFRENRQEMGDETVDVADIS
ncbi:hypothetical protein LY16_01558 [Xenorhabdus doucetiae]|uniref:Uncharacterized protein n=1 Tax=Xenorhabdus doucetiae TaxID=351671 RepID=A0ABY3NTW1_9GAMM|nr:hypothetical protein LY16_01558 [Xenorhabdus doucetiae]